MFAVYSKLKQRMRVPNIIACILQFYLFLLQKLVLQGYIIGHVQLRKVKATERDCAAMNDMPYLSLKCRNISTTPSSEPENSRFQSKSSPYLLFGQHGIYDNSGHVIKLNYSRCVICNILCRIDIYKIILLLYV